MNYPDQTGEKLAEVMMQLDALFPDHDIAIVVASPLTGLVSAMMNHQDINRAELARHLAEGTEAGHITIGN
jgi:hypothetical protein